jgi:excisionase family DNA binding protein
MTMEALKPFTPKALAERWACSESHIYKMISDGRLNGFRLGGGKLVRIGVEEVLRWESGQANQNTGPIMSENIGSTGTSTNSPHAGKRAAQGGVSDLASQRRMTRDLRSIGLRASSKN